MTSANKVKVTTPSDLEIAVERKFNSPRKLVFEAFTKPELVKRWLFGPDEWPMVECKIDLRVGGAYRYVWRNKEKGDMGLSGVYREITPPTRIVHTEKFDQGWPGGDVVVTTVFVEQGGQTIVTATVLCSSKEARDGALKSGMIGGWSRCYERLDTLLAA